MNLLSESCVVSFLGIFACIISLEPFLKSVICIFPPQIYLWNYGTYPQLFLRHLHILLDLSSPGWKNLKLNILKLYYFLLHCYKYALSPQMHVLEGHHSFLGPKDGNLRIKLFLFHTTYVFNLSVLVFRFTFIRALSIVFNSYLPEQKLS